MPSKKKIKSKSSIDQLQDRLREMSLNPPTIDKVFSFSMEDLQDTPNVCLAEIVQYLSEHEGKIDDYWFTSRIDPDTFRPLLTMHIVPVKEISKGLTEARNSIWEKLSEIKLVSVE